jgi:hypothetical protein
VDDCRSGGGRALLRCNWTDHGVRTLKEVPEHWRRVTWAITRPVAETSRAVLMRCLGAVFSLVTGDTPRVAHVLQAVG